MNKFKPQPFLFLILSFFLYSELLQAQNFWDSFRYDEQGKLLQVADPVQDAWKRIIEKTTEVIKPGENAAETAIRRLEFSATTSAIINERLDQLLDFSTPQTPSSIRERIRVLGWFLDTNAIPSGKMLILKAVMERLVTEQDQVATNPMHFNGIANIELPAQWPTKPDPLKGKSIFDLLPQGDLEFRKNIQSSFYFSALEEAAKLTTEKEKLQFWGEFVKFEEAKRHFNYPARDVEKLVSYDEYSQLNAYMSQTAMAEMVKIAKETINPSVKEVVYMHLMLAARVPQHSGDGRVFTNQVAKDYLQEALSTDTNSAIAGIRASLEWMKLHGHSFDSLAINDMQRVITEKLLANLNFNGDSGKVNALTRLLSELKGEKMKVQVTESAAESSKPSPKFWEALSFAPDGSLAHPTEQVSASWQELMKAANETTAAAANDPKVSRLSAILYIHHAVEAQLDKLMDFSKPMTFFEAQERANILSSFAKSENISEVRRIKITAIVQKLIAEARMLDSNPLHFVGIADFQLPPQWSNESMPLGKSGDLRDHMPSGNVEMRSSLQTAFSAVAAQEAAKLKSVEEKLQFWGELSKYGWPRAFGVSAEVESKLFANYEKSHFYAFMSVNGSRELASIARESTDPKVKEAAYMYLTIASGHKMHIGDRDTYNDEIALEYLRQGLLSDTDAASAGILRGQQWLKDRRNIAESSANTAIRELRKLIAERVLVDEHIVSDAAQKQKIEELLEVYDGSKTTLSFLSDTSHAKTSFLSRVKNSPLGTRFLSLCRRALGSILGGR